MKNDKTILVSVHTPKCAGSSFLAWLQKEYGKERVYLDYLDYPTNPASIMNIDPCGFLANYRDGYSYLEGKKVVHGHFWVKKYQYLKDATRITFLRDPVERAISNYFYWLKMPRVNDTVHNYFLNNKLSIEQFCHLPSIRNMYTQVFFRDVDMHIFDYIGQYNDLNKEMLRLSKILGVSIALPSVNINPSKSYNEKVQEIMGNETLVSKIRDLLSDDIRFYEKYVGK